MSEFSVTPYSVSSGDEGVKRAEEKALLEQLQEKQQEKKAQQQKQQIKAQEAKQSEQKQLQKVEEQKNQEIKILESVAKTLKTEVNKLTPEDLKKVLPEMKKAEVEAIQKILEANKLVDIQKNYQDKKLEESGIKHKVSDEMKLLQQMAKELKVPVEELSEQDVKNFLDKQKKREEFVPKKIGQKESAKETRETKESVLDKKPTVKSEIEVKYSKIKDLLQSLKDKQQNVLKEAKSKNESKEQLKTINKQIETLENKLTDLKDQLKDVQKKAEFSLKEQQTKEAKGKEESKPSIESEIDNLKQELGKLKGKGTKDELQEVIDKFKSTVKDEKDAGKKELLNQKIQTAQQALGSAKDKDLAKVKEQVLNSLTEGDDLDAEDEAAKLKEQISTEKDAGKKQELEGKLNKLQQTIVKIKSEASKEATKIVGKEQNIDVEEEVGKLKEQIDNEKNVGKKQELEGKFNKLQKLAQLAKKEASQEASKIIKGEQDVDAEDEAAKLKEQISTEKDAGKKQELEGKLNKLQQTIAKTKSEASKEATKIVGKDAAAEPAKAAEAEVDDLKDGEVLSKKIQKEVTDTEKKLKGLKNKKEILQKDLKSKAKPELQQKVLDSKIRELKGKLHDLKAQLLVNKEIKELNSKDMKKLEVEADNEIQELESVIKDLETAKGLKDSSAIRKNISQMNNQKLANGLLKNIDKATEKDALLSKILDSENPKLSGKEIKLLGQLDTEHLGLKNLQKFAKVLNKYANSVEGKLSEILASEEVDSVDFDSRLYKASKYQAVHQFIDVVKQIKNQKLIQETLNGERERAISDGDDSSTAASAAEGAMSKETKEQEAKRKVLSFANNLAEEFDNLDSEESSAKFISILRGLYVNNAPNFQALLKELMDKGKIDKQTIEEDLGIVVGGDKDGHLKLEAVKPETLEAFQKIFNLSPEELANNELLQRFLDKGRIDRKQFQKLLNKKISDTSWDYGVLSFNSNSIGVLKERAEVNSLADFWQLMERMSRNGSDEDTKETAEIFLTKQSFSNTERDLISLFVSEYEENFIDPDFHLFDIYNKYLKDRPFRTLDNSIREELAIAVLIRLIKDIDAEDKHKLYGQLMQYANMDYRSKEFYRSVHIFEYYFSHGGKIKEDYLDISKDLSFVTETTHWDEEKERQVVLSTISKVVKGMTAPTKELPKVKLRSLSDRLKKKKKAK